jgi:hypothetical protein
VATHASPSTGDNEVTPVKAKEICVGGNRGLVGGRHRELLGSAY